MTVTHTCLKNVFNFFVTLELSGYRESNRITFAAHKINLYDANPQRVSKKKKQHNPPKQN